MSKQDKTKNNQKKSPAGNKKSDSIGSSQIIALVDKFMAKFKALAKSQINRWPNPNAGRWDKLGLENSWKFFAPVIIAIVIIAIIKIIPLPVYIVLLVLLAIALVWLSKK
jgi:hypothetical protein